MIIHHGHFQRRYTLETFAEAMGQTIKDIG
jgi:hypothetical protein